MLKSSVFVALGALVALSFSANVVFADGSATGQQDYRPGQVIVKFRSDVPRTRQEMDQLYDAAGVRNVERFSGIELLNLKDGVKVQDAIAELQKSGWVEYAQPNYILSVPEQNFRMQDGVGGGIPCIPGMNIPGCTPNSNPTNIPTGIPTDIPTNFPTTIPTNPGGGGGTPCIFPGVQFPPGCTDPNNPSPAPSPAPVPTTQPSNPTAPTYPALQPAPAEVNPPVADPQLSQDYGLTKIGAIDAWNTFRGDKKFIVADIDTGIDYNHEDLSFNLWRNPNPGPKNDVVGYDFVHDDGLPYDDNGHGTHTAGTIGAVGGNGIGTSGVAQRVSIMALKFLGSDGSGDTATAVKAIDYAIQHGAKVLSNSWGGPSDPGNQALLDAINRAQSAGVLFVAAAGNGDAFGNPQNDDDPNSASYPAAFNTDNLIAVAATDEQDDLAFFSNYGVKTVALAAPGVNVYSTLPGNKYGEETGTSMACPHVAGAAALVWADHPSWNYKQVKKALLDNVDVVPSLQGKILTGGRLDVLKALRSTE